MYFLNQSTQEVLPTLRDEAPNNCVKCKIVGEFEYVSHQKLNYKGIKRLVQGRKTWVVMKNSSRVQKFFTSMSMGLYFSEDFNNE